MYVWTIFLWCLCSLGKSWCWIKIIWNFAHITESLSFWGWENYDWATVDTLRRGPRSSPVVLKVDHFLLCAWIFESLKILTKSLESFYTCPNMFFGSGKTLFGLRSTNVSAFAESLRFRLYSFQGLSLLLIYNVIILKHLANWETLLRKHCFLSMFCHVSHRCFVMFPTVGNLGNIC